MNEQKKKSLWTLWRQRTASFMVMVLMAGSLLFDMPPVYAAEGVAETAEQVSAAGAAEQDDAVETAGQVSAVEITGQVGAAGAAEQTGATESEEEQVSVPGDRSYTGEGYTVDASVTTSWEGGYNLYVTIYNTSEETIHNWGVVFETQDSIRDLYNAEIMSGRDGLYLLRNKVYNQDIPAGGSVSFGYTAYYTGMADVPGEYVVSSIEKTVESGGFTVSCLVSDAWESGAVVQLMIKNTSDAAIEDWILEFDSNMQMEELWNADLVFYEAGHYVLRNVSYAQNIPVGETALVGMRLSALPGTEGELLENVTVRQIVPSGGNGVAPSDNQVSDNSVSDNNVSDNNVSDNNVSDNGVSGNEIPEGVINRLATGGDGGEIYYKTSYESDVVTAPDGLPCIRNQFLLSADDTISFAEVEAYLAQNGARIVGYIEATNDYQVEMYRETDITEVQELTERIGLQAWVRHIGLNYLWLEEACFQSSDPWTGSSDEDEILQESTLNSSTPGGNNWGLELIDFEGALINAGVINSSQSLSTDVCIEHLTTAKMGIIDSGFDVWHEDLDDNFVEAISNYEKQSDLWGDSLLSHGTHVAGIMCAEFNNGIGMNGICIKNELYGAALYENSYSANDLKNKCETTFSIMCKLGFLIQHNVKVINYSSGVSDGMAYSASVDPQNSIAIKYLNNNASRISNLLLNYLKEGYNFLIVTSAGNGNGSKFYEVKEGFQAGYDYEYIPSSEIMEWEVKEGLVYPDLLSPEGAVDAKYASVFNYIPATSLCYDHILCVGALQLNEDGSICIAPYSNGGSRVDIYAPGSNIYSTYVMGAKCMDLHHNNCGTGYGHMDGTSMAAPHVSGVAGLAYNVNPDVSAADLKQITINNAQDINGVPVLNAADVVADVVNYNTNEAYNTKLIIVDEQGNPLPGVQVEIRQHAYYWFEVSHAAMIANAVGDTVIYSGETNSAGYIKLTLPRGRYYVLAEGAVAGEAVGGFEELGISYEDELDQRDREMVISTYTEGDTHQAAFQFHSFEQGEYINAKGFYENIEVNLWYGWIDKVGSSAVPVTNLTIVPSIYDYIVKGLSGGAYTLEVTIPGNDPCYYHIMIPDNQTNIIYRFEM